MVQSTSPVSRVSIWSCKLQIAAQISRNGLPLLIPFAGSFWHWEISANTKAPEVIVPATNATVIASTRIVCLSLISRWTFYLISK